MENLIQLNEKMVIHKVTYETSQSVVTAECEIIHLNRSMRVSFLISHSDLNRILAKLISKGYDFDNRRFQTILLEDGTEIVDYHFDNNEPAVLESFNFKDNVTEIRA